MKFSSYKILSLIDYTTLKPTDSSVDIIHLCKNATTPKGTVAAICILPAFVALARQNLVDKAIRIATVAHFPSGEESLQQTLHSITSSLQAGADEIDVVMPYKKYLQGERNYCRDFIAACKKTCDKKLLKVIIESGELKDSKIIEQAAFDMCEAGADFVKTSTGFTPVGATPEAAQAILQALQHYQTKTGKLIGFKASGGIRTAESAMLYMELAENIFGPVYLHPNTFRIGASQLVASLQDEN